MHRSVDAVRRAYDTVAVAARYDADRFSSVRGRLYAARQRRLIGRCLARFGRVACLLDLPCGTGRLLSLGAAAADTVVGVDTARAMLARAADRPKVPNVALVAGDAMGLPLRDDAVDVVLCVKFLHLLPPDATDAALAEIARVARRGAVATLLVDYPVGPVARLRRRVLRRPRIVDPPPSLGAWSARCAAAGLRLAAAHRLWPGLSHEAVVLLRR